MLFRKIATTVIYSNTVKLVCRYSVNIADTFRVILQILAVAISFFY